MKNQKGCLGGFSKFINLFMISGKNEQQRRCTRNGDCLEDRDTKNAVWLLRRTLKHDGRKAGGDHPFNSMVSETIEEGGTVGRGVRW